MIMTVDKLYTCALNGDRFPAKALMRFPPCNISPDTLLQQFDKIYKIKKKEFQSSVYKILKCWFTKF